MRVAAVVFGLLVIAGIPRSARAQSPDPPAPPIVRPGPPGLAERPMRFLLSTGAVVIGTRIGENAHSIGVRTSSGLTTLHKSQIVAMDHLVERGRSFDLRSQPVPLARRAPPLPDPVRGPPRPRAHPGRGAVVAGSILFGLSYTVSCLAGFFSMTMGEEPDSALLLAIPGAGPALWGFRDREQIAAGLLLTAAEAIGAAFLVHGIVTAGGGDERRARPRPWALHPVLTAELRGLAVSGRL